MTEAQADLLLAAIAQVATEFTPFREGWPEVSDTPAEASEIAEGAKAFSRELGNAVRAIQVLQPEVVARWRRT